MYGTSPPARLAIEYRLHIPNQFDPIHHNPQTVPSIFGFLVFFLAYYLSHHSPFTYVEVDTAALAAKSARCVRRQSWA